MTFPQVQVNQIDLAQSAPNEIERHLLFISYAPPENYEPGFYTLNTQTDLDKINSLAGDDIRAAMMNAGQNWSAAVYFMDSDEKWQDVVKDCQKYGSFEGIVLLEDFAGWNEDESGFSLTKSAKEAAALRQELIAKHGRWTWFILPVKNPAGGDMTWQQYSAALTQWQTGLVADGVMLVPRLYENLPGVIAGRLCNRLVTIADTPARVLTGSLVYVGNATKDKNGETVTADIVRALDAARYSVPVTYADFEGIYWNDGPLLAAKGSDYQSIRILRIVDKVARQVRLLAIRNIGNRSLNSTPASMEYNKMVLRNHFAQWQKAALLTAFRSPVKCIHRKRAMLSSRGLIPRT